MYTVTWIYTRFYKVNPKLILDVPTKFHAILENLLVRYIVLLKMRQMYK